MALTRGIDVSQLTHPRADLAECQDWPRARMTRGHGHGYMDGRHFLAHVAGYEAKNGPVPAGYVVHHLCGNPPCCNPDHLVAVSRKEHASLHPASGMAAVHAAAEVCSEGHPFDHHDGRQRICLTCKRKRGREWARQKVGGAA
jgi:hypothetical protein